MSAIELKGIYPPLPTFFDNNENLDLETFERHVRRMSDSEVAGYVVMGSNGEAPHLTRSERRALVAVCREVCMATDHEQKRAVSRQVLAGCGEQSTRSTIVNCEQAARAGADAALILPPFYFKGRMDTPALLSHFQAIADRSPIPVVIYNMPANTAGLDLDAKTVSALAEHSNIVGLKDSSGNIAKLTQVVAETDVDFNVLAGSAGYLLPAMIVGARGAIAALANIFPNEVCQLYELCLAGKWEAARTLQARLIPANTAITATYNVAGLKAALELVAGYGGRPRLPLLPLNEQEETHLAGLLRVLQT